VIFDLAYELLPYAAALYVLDSAVRVRAGETLIVSIWGGRFREAGPGWHLSGLLPTAEVFVVGGPAAGATPTAAAPLAATPPKAADSSAADSGPASVLAAIRRIRDAQSPAARPLAALGAVLLAIVFGALPVIVYLRPPDPGPVVIAVTAAAVLWIAIVAVAVRALRRAGLSAAATLSAIAPALFFPPAAAHALSFLRRDAYRAFPPLAVAAVLLPAPDFRRRVRRELRRLDDEAVGAPAARAALLGLVAVAGIDLDEGLAAPASHGDAALVCPICEAGYRAGFTTCADCDIELVQFAPAAR
jgi:hypothetical protein